MNKEVRRGDEFPELFVAMRLETEQVQRLGLTTARPSAEEIGYDAYVRREMALAGQLTDIVDELWRDRLVSFIVVSGRVVYTSISSVDEFDRAAFAATQLVEPVLMTRPRDGVKLPTSLISYRPD